MEKFMIRIVTLNVSSIILQQADECEKCAMRRKWNRKVWLVFSLILPFLL
jgi:hypothetical protein